MIGKRWAISTTYEYKEQTKKKQRRKWYTPAIVSILLKPTVMCPCNTILEPSSCAILCSMQPKINIVPFCVPFVHSIGDLIRYDCDFCSSSRCNFVRNSTCCVYTITLIKYDCFKMENWKSVSISLEMVGTWLQIIQSATWHCVDSDWNANGYCMCVRVRYFQNHKKRKFPSKSSIPYSNLFISTHNPLVFFRIITQTHTQTSNIHIHTLCWTMLAARLITFIRNRHAENRFENK